MKQYTGAVLFVDILGIGALTKNKVELTDTDYDAFQISKEHKSAQIFCAHLLIRFRSILAKTNKNNPSINIAQLSDCAFIWSNDAISVLNAARKIMFQAIQCGILIRGGIAYGEIVEPDKVNRSIGNFILGEAATKAAGIESAGKGCRIFSDLELPSALSSINPSLQYLFTPLKSPLDGAIVDEFKWYLPDDFGLISTKPKSYRRKCAHDLLELISLLKHSPWFNWNASSKDGEIQLALGIESISAATKNLLNTEDFCFTVEYLIGGLGNRNEGTHEKILRKYKDEVNKLLGF